MNNGTRQADTGSCFTDAIYIVKEALNDRQITGSALLQDYQAEDLTAVTPTGYKSLFSQHVSKPSNFFLFTLPAVLLKTSQRSELIKEANADPNAVVHRSGVTLHEHQERHRIRVTFLSKQLEGNASTFLHSKALEHKEMIDNQLRARTAVQFFAATREQEDKLSELIENYLPYKKPTRS